jgi:hypothetical protein
MVERAQLLSLRRAPGSDADHLRPECVPLVLGGIVTTNEQSKGVNRTPEQECAHCGHPAHERYCTADECQCAFFATPERKP